MYEPAEGCLAIRKLAAQQAAHSLIVTRLNPYA